MARLTNKRDWHGRLMGPLDFARRRTVIDLVDDRLKTLVDLYRFHQYRFKRLTPRRLAKETGLSHATIANVFASGRATPVVQSKLLDWWRDHKQEFMEE